MKCGKGDVFMGVVFIVEGKIKVCELAFSSELKFKGSRIFMFFSSFSG